MELHEEAAARLASAGQRYTPTRRRLVGILAKAGTPLSLPDIVRGRKDLPQSSAYRNLAEGFRAVDAVASEDGFARYELAEELTDHHPSCAPAAVACRTPPAGLEPAARCWMRSPGSRFASSARWT